MRSVFPKLMAGGLLLAGLAVPALSTPQHGQSAPAPAPAPAPMPSHETGQPAAAESKPAAGADSHQQHPNPLEKLIAGHENEPAETVFNNIRVLKGLPAGRLLDTMRGFSAGLGTNCKKCHDTENFASDDKEEKNTARGMIQLTKGINDQFRTMTGQDRDAVSCYTCHHGQSHPAFRPEGSGARDEHEHHEQH